MKITFIAALYNLDISTPLRRGEKIDDNTFISNDSSLISKLIPSSKVHSIGTLEYNALLNSRTFIYSKEDIPSEISPEDYLVDRLFFIQSFLAALWLKNDTSVDFERGFTFCTLGVSSNCLATSYTSSKSEKVECILNREQLREVRKLARDELSYIKYSHKERKATQLLKKNTRFESALYHIQGARLESDLGLKIAKYCSALEALFSTSHAELSHQLSERLAFCISSSSVERLENYRKSKKAYGIRSKIVHGAHIKESDIPEAKNISTFCDDALRAIVSKKLSNKKFSESFLTNESLDNYMLRLIFGVNERE